MLYYKTEYVEKHEIISIPRTKSLDDVIELLKQLKTANKESFVEYKGNYFSTADLEETVDSLYYAVYGIPKSEYLKLQTRQRALRVIYPENDDRFLFRLSYLQAEETERLLDIMEAIEADPTYKIAITLYDSNPNNQSLLRLIQTYSKHGTDFVKALYQAKELEIPGKWIRNIKATEEQNEKYKKNNTERDPIDITFDDSVEIEKLFIQIRKAQNRDEEILYHYKGVEILSSSIENIDDIYKLVYGATKEEKTDIDKRKQAIAEIPYILFRSKNLIKPEKQAEWEKCVKASAAGNNYGIEVKLAVGYMNAANKNLEIHFDYMTNYSDEIIKTTVSIILEYSIKGKEFWENLGINNIESHNKGLH